MSSPLLISEATNEVFYKERRRKLSGVQSDVMQYTNLERQYEAILNNFTKNGKCITQDHYNNCVTTYATMVMRFMELRKMYTEILGEEALLLDAETCILFNVIPSEQLNEINMLMKEYIVSACKRITSASNVLLALIAAQPSGPVVSVDLAHFGIGNKL